MLANRSVGQLPTNTKFDNSKTLKSFNLKKNSSNLSFSKEFQRLYPELPPPRPKDLINRKFIPVEKPKFLRDSLSVSDIPGAQIKKLYTRPARDIMKYRDIEGTCPKKELFRLKRRENDDYSDITKKPKWLFLSDHLNKTKMNNYNRLLKNKNNSLNQDKENKVHLLNFRNNSVIQNVSI